MNRRGFLSRAGVAVAGAVAIPHALKALFAPNVAPPMTDEERFPIFSVEYRDGMYRTGRPGDYWHAVNAQSASPKMTHDDLRALWARCENAPPPRWPVG